MLLFSLCGWAQGYCRQERKCKNLLDFHCEFNPLEASELPRNACNADIFVSCGRKVKIPLVNASSNREFPYIFSRALVPDLVHQQVPETAQILCTSAFLKQPKRHG